MDCTTCKEIKTTAPVPYIVHESAMARNERHIKRLIIALVIAVIMIVASNLAWLYVWQLYDYSGETIEERYEYMQDGKGVNIIGDRNGVDFHGAESDLCEADYTENQN